MLGLGLFAYALNFYFGKKKNETIAASWMHALTPVFQANFEHLGANDSEEPPLQKESDHAYKFFATGRYNCAYALATLELVKRQDLLSTAVLGLVWPQHDKMIVEIPIKPMQRQPLVFGVTKAQLLKKIRKSVDDLKNFARVCKCDDVSSSLRVLSESDEVATEFLDSKAKSMLNALAPHLQLLYLTDLYTIKPPFSLSLQGEFFVPSHNRETVVAMMMTFMIYVADLASNFRLSNSARAVAEKERVVVSERKLKKQKEEGEDLLAKKKAEKRRQEEEWKATLSKEKLRKLEEKQHKQALKKSGPRMKVVKG